MSSTLLVSATRVIIVVAALILTAGCGSILKRDTMGKTPSATSVKSGIATKKGGYYLDDGPGDNPPADLASIPDAVPRDEPLRQANMRPYVALGKSYAPMTALKSYRERGIASWYGRRYHGQKTASGEPYDMYTMTAAHTTLPLPSYARVTNIRNGKSVVVRVNDRGPFHSDRLIDLSYTAAYKLGVLDGGSAWVEVESILPGAGSAMQVASAPILVPNSALQPSPIPATVREKTIPRPLAAEPQNGEARPDLFEAAYSPPPSGTSISAAADTPATPETGGIYLQLGAFSAYDNADNFLTHMRAELPSLTNILGIVSKDGLFKVHAGPYPDQLLARQAADKIAQTLSVKPMLLVR
ncbi:MAG: septal ring lytic transglycosylase RlpA family protein [Pseudomonadota bacterium]|nr:septal ring lytic transglycosylase RlpA family protein [Pseudomonadota bacterium]